MNEWVYFVPYCGLLQLPIFLSVSTTKLDVVLGQELSALFTRTVCPKGKGKCQTVVYKVWKEGRDGRSRSSKRLSSSWGGQVSSWNNLRMTWVTLIAVTVQRVPDAHRRKDGASWKWVAWD